MGRSFFAFLRCSARPPLSHGEKFNNKQDKRFIGGIKQRQRTRSEKKAKNNNYVEVSKWIERIQLLKVTRYNKSQRSRRTIPIRLLCWHSVSLSLRGFFFAFAIWYVVSGVTGYTCVCVCVCSMCSMCFFFSLSFRICRLCNSFLFFPNIHSRFPAK